MKFIIIFSLGAHIAGLAAKHLKVISPSTGKIACIIGLDPASVGFYMSKPKSRLGKTDADYVQIIHTDSDKFGIPNAIGHGRFEVLN